MRKIILVLCIAFILSKSLRIMQDDTVKNLGNGVPNAAKQKAGMFANTANFKQGITDIMDSVDRVAQSLKVSKHREIKEIIERDGWDRLNLKTQIFVMTGLMEEKYYAYCENRGKALKLPKEVYEHYNITAEYGPWTVDDALYNKADFIYTDENIKNSYDSFTVLASQGKRDGTYDILISQFQVLDFKIADDLIWYKYSNSYTNFFQEDGEEFVKRPKILTEKQLEALLDVMKLISYKFLADTFGVKFDLSGAIA